jgi:hypothetical protein
MLRRSHLPAVYVTPTRRPGPLSVFTLLLHERSTREPKSEREKGREGEAGDGGGGRARGGAGGGRRTTAVPGGGLTPTVTAAPKGQVRGSSCLEAAVAREVRL